MFFELLAKIHNKPESTRRRIVFVLSIMITAVIFTIWFFVTDFSSMQESSTIVVSASSTPPQEPFKPIESLKVIFSGFMDNIGSIKDAFKQ